MPTFTFKIDGNASAMEVNGQFCTDDILKVFSSCCFLMRKLEQEGIPEPGQEKVSNEEMIRKVESLIGFGSPTVIGRTDKHLN